MDFSKQDLIKHILKIYAIFQSKLNQAKIDVDIEQYIVMHRGIGAWTFGLAGESKIVVKDFRDLNDNLVFFPFYIPVINDRNSYRCGNAIICHLFRETLEKFDESTLVKLLRCLSMNGLHVSLNSYNYEQIDYKILELDGKIEELRCKWLESNNTDQQCILDIRSCIMQRNELSNSKEIDVVIVPKSFKTLDEFFVWLDMNDVE